MAKVFIDYDSMSVEDENGKSARVRVSFDDDVDDIVKFFEVLGAEVEISEG